MTDPASSDADSVELLHPFYLDTDMSMAFAAALSGGIALQREEVERDNQESQAVRNLRGNLRVFDVLGLGGSRERQEGEETGTESRLIRHHTEASIFIALHDELQRAGQIREANLSALKPGDIVSINIGPAVAPLRRIVDQILRLFDVVAPLDNDDPSSTDPAPGQTRQERRQQARLAAKQAITQSNGDSAEINSLRGIFLALQDDLERSGMVDVVVKREDDPSIILTLDKRFVSDQTLELLHTSEFTVIGKVTQIWPAEDDFVNLYRRSVLSLAPALIQTVTWSMLGFLFALAKSLPVGDAEKAAWEASGMDKPDATLETDENAEEEPAAAPDAEDDVVVGEEAVNALHPGVNGPAFQILPLAICA
jgi:hypothetical protein